MSVRFCTLSDSDLRSLVMGLRSGRVTVPSSTLQLRRYVSMTSAELIMPALHELAERNFAPSQVATSLEMILADRVTNCERRQSGIDLVTSGPEAPGITNRDTSVVVRELFGHATSRVMVVGYAIYQGQKVFETLAQRMNDLPELDVEFYLNISRPDRDTTKAEVLVSRFVERFKTAQWPSGSRLPRVYYDPRSIADDGRIRSSLHAKCVVVDSSHVFVSSANFTEAGQERNIEVGLHLNSDWLAKKIDIHFSQMRDHGLFQRAI